MKTITPLLSSSQPPLGFSGVNRGALLPRVRSLIIAIASAAALCSHVASARVSVIYNAGAWQTLGGQADDGTPMCSVQVIGRDRSFFVKWFADRAGLTVHVAKQGWSIPDGANAAMSIRFDQNGSFIGTGVGFHGFMVAMAIAEDSLGRFLDQLRYATTMTVSFPSGNEGEWSANMTGSNAAVVKMLECVNWTLHPQPTQPTQPYTSQAQPPAVTQPYPTQPRRSNPTPVEAVHPVVKETI